MKSKTNLLSYCRTYPKLQIEDLFKFIYQSAFGCEHLVSDKNVAVDCIKREFSRMDKSDSAVTIPLDGKYSRVPLNILSNGMSAETLGTLFCFSAQKEPEGREELLRKLKITRELIAGGELKFSLDEFDRKVSVWETEGFNAVHHSQVFRDEYKPHYRVISNKFVSFIPFFTEVDKRVGEDSVIIAIEGGSASGKTSLAEVLSEIYDCNIFHMDDFFLRPEQRMSERFSEVGGNVDRERFLSEVLIPLSEKREVRFRKFNCSVQRLDNAITVAPKKLNFVEGVYSMHPSLEKFYDFSVFLDISPKKQRDRILVRNSPQLAKRFFDEWIPFETRYFSETQIKNRCDMTVFVDY